MSKKSVRIVAALLVALLALTLIPLGAFAADDTSVSAPSESIPANSAWFNGTFFYDKENPTFADEIIGSEVTTLYGELFPGDKLKTDDWELLIGSGDDIYEFRGFASNGEFEKKITSWMIDRNVSGKGWTREELEKVAEQYRKETKITFNNFDIKIPAFPSDPKKQGDWYYKYSSLFAGYTPHDHKLSNWYSDGTTHWRECLECKKYNAFHDPFMYQNWCQDGDEDGICNVCGGDVPYHDIKVIETEGATVTLNRDNASHRMKITADVEAKDGYTVGKVHFVKVRDDGSKQEITSHKKNGQFFTYMPTYEMEISVDVTKK